MMAQIIDFKRQETVMGYNAAGLVTSITALDGCSPLFLMMPSSEESASCIPMASPSPLLILS